MTDEFFLDQLDALAEEEAPIPAAETFMPTGMVAPWTARHLFRQGGYDDLAATEFGIPFLYRRKTKSGFYFYFFDSAEAAALATEAMNCDYPAISVMVLHTQVANVISFRKESAKEKWGTEAYFDCRVNTPISVTYRHEYQLFMLPSIVQALAKLEGIDVPKLDLLPLIEIREEGLSDERRVELIGGPDGWEESYYGQYRAKLWALLDEEDPKHYLKPDTVTQEGKPHKYAVVSEKLDRYLKFGRTDWKTPLWASVIRVPDPGLKATFSSGGRNELPIVTDFYPNREAALASLGDVAEAEEGDGLPAVPAAWTEMPDQWREVVGEIKKIVASGTPLPIAYNQQGGANLGATQAEVAAWLDFV